MTDVPKFRVLVPANPVDDEAEVDPAKIIGAHTAREVEKAVMYAGGRCESEEDAMQRLRVEQVDRSRGRMPQFVVWLDGQRVWTGAYERSTEGDEKLVWLARWHSYAPDTFEPHHRWRAEPEKACTQVVSDEHGTHWVAKVRRPSGDQAHEVDGIGTMFVARATTSDGAILAVYAEIDKRSMIAEGETMQ